MSPHLTRWPELKPLLKKRFTQLSDDDLVYVKGHETELLARLQIKIGQTEDDIDRIIRSFHVAYLAPRQLL